MLSAAARIEFGNISPSKTQTIGPHVAAKKATKRFSETTATMPRLSDRIGLPTVDSATPAPATIFGAVAKTTASVPSVAAIPNEPTSRSGLRPTRSIRRIATIVKTTLTMLMIVEVLKASVSSKPTEAQIRFE